MMTIRWVFLLSMLGWGFRSWASTEIMGSIAGNASDLVLPPQAIALGPKPIEWCVEYSRDFGVERKVLVEAIGSAFLQWRNYIKQKDVNTYYAKAPDLPLLTFNDHFQEACNQETELRFYAGIDVPGLAEERAKYNQPLSFSRIKPDNKAVGRRKGYVWLRPSGQGEFPVDWRYAPNLMGVLLHELGHLAGCGHVDGTIMAANLAKVMRQAPALDKTTDGAALLLTHIDFFRELSFASFSGITLYDHQRQSQGNIYYEQLATFYQRVVGEAPRGGAIYQKFYQFKGTLEGGRVRASLFMADQEGFEKAVKRDAYKDEEMHRIDFVFDPPKPGDVREIGSEMVFRRLFKGAEFFLYPVTAVWHGAAKFARVRNQSREISLEVTYARNVDRFTELNKWNKDLVTLSARDDNDRGENALFFRAAFDKQQMHTDGFFQAPGGAYYERIRRLLGKPAHPE